MIQALAKVPAPRKLPAKLKLKLERAMDSWFEHLEPHTKRSYHRAIVHFAQWLHSQEVISLPPEPPVRAPERPEWEAGAVQEATQYLLALQPPAPSLVVQGFVDDMLEPGPKGAPAYTRATAQGRLAAIRWLTRQGRRLGQINWTLEVDIPKPKKDKSGRLIDKPGRDMEGPTKAEAAKLLVAAQEDEDPRAFFVMSILRYEGFREHEIRQLNYEDLNPKRKTVKVARKKRTEAKEFPMSSHTWKALQGWLKVRGKEPGPLLYGGPYGKTEGSRIGSTTIYYLVQRIGAEAGVETSPHKIRHRACTDIVRAAIAQLLPEEEILFLTGHSSRKALAPYYEASKSKKKARNVLNSLDSLIDEDDE